MTATSWPIDTLSPESYNWRIAGKTVVGGQTVSGYVQTGVFGGGGFWSLELDRIAVYTAAEHLALRTMQAVLDGGATPVIIAIPDYAVMVNVTPQPTNVTNYGSAALGATSIVINVTAGPPMTAGYVFSVNDADGNPRRHEIVSASPAGGDHYNVTIRPPLRSAVSNGAALDFLTPGCVMKIADPASIYCKMLTGRFGEISPTFIEYFG